MMTAGRSVTAEIDKIRELEEENYQTARRLLGKSVSFVDDLVNLYDLFARMVKDSGVGPRDEIVVSLQFLLACRYQLVLGATAALRGHLSDSHLYTRKAIEFSAFAARVNKH